MTTSRLRWTRRAPVAPEVVSWLAKTSTSARESVADTTAEDTAVVSWSIRSRTVSARTRCIAAAYSSAKAGVIPRRVAATSPSKESWW